MSESKMEKMKKIIEAKKNPENNHHLKPNKKMGATNKSFANMKSGGSNNKV